MLETDVVAMFSFSRVLRAAYKGRHRYPRVAGKGSNDFSLPGGPGSVSSAWGHESLLPIMGMVWWGLDFAHRASSSVQATIL